MKLLRQGTRVIVAVGIITVIVVSTALVAVLTAVSLATFFASGGFRTPLTTLRLLHRHLLVALCGRASVARGGEPQHATHPIKPPHRWRRTPWQRHTGKARGEAARPEAPQNHAAAAHFLDVLGQRQGPTRVDERILRRRQQLVETGATKAG